MNQSAILTGALIGGFVLFLAARDRLPVYARILWGDKPGTHSEASEGEKPKEDGFTFGDAFKPFGYLDALPDIPNFNWDLPE